MTSWQTFPPALCNALVIFRLRVYSAWDQLFPLHWPDFVMLASYVPGKHLCSFSLKREIRELIGLCDKADPIICPGTARHHFSHHRKMAHSHQKEKKKKKKKDALIAGHYLMTMALLTHANPSDVLRNLRNEMKGAVAEESLFLVLLLKWRNGKWNLRQQSCRLKEID